MVRLDPQDDNSYAHIHKFGVQKGTKLLTPAEGDALRNLLLADKELGKTVGVNGVAGEGYIVLSTFPKIAELHSFFRSVASEEMDYSVFYSLNVAKIAAATVPKSDKGGFRRRRSLRKSSKRAQRKNSRGTKLR